MKDFKYKGFSSKELYSTVRDKFMIEERELYEDENLTSGRTYIYKPIRIKKLNKITNKTVAFKKLDLDYLNSWLLNNKDYEVLEIDGYIYKALFFPANDLYIKDADKGYIDLKVRIYKNAFSSILACGKVLTDRIIDGVYGSEKLLDINNKSNIEGLIIYPNFIISNIPKRGYKSATTIEIENTSIINNKLNINLSENERIYINGKNNYIESNKDREIRKTGEYIKFKQNLNKIKLKSDGYCEINISYQQEFNIEGAWNLE
ncbi:hypothetical protein [Clostridium tertium]|uniref:hypothetical protein n=1 Tax=Clostridium tertium TaxID=1559 RepID=UPI0018AC1825|nr:hypothetical protein [Clostridium tertium]MBU6135227.1 hypothetical protein [Clostridium tertium]